MAVQTKSPLKTTTVGQYLLNRLQSHGVDHIFGLPGDYILRFDKLIEDHPINWINTTRENTAGYMADAYARLRGLGTACVTYGVGINIINATSQAFVESSPIVIISGAASTEEFRRSQRLHHLFNKPSNKPRDTTQLEIFKKITVAQTVLENPATAAAEIDRVIDVCLLRKKPVYIEIPRNQVDTIIPYPEYASMSYRESDPKALGELLQEVNRILKNCRSPVIWAGHEIHRYGLAESLLKFAEKTRIPIVSSLLGKSAISEYHPLYVGVYQGEVSKEEVNRFIAGCDCLLSLGVVYNDVNTGGFTVQIETDHTIKATAEAINVDYHNYGEVFFADFIRGLGDLEHNVRFQTEYPACVDHSFPTFKSKKGRKITSARLFECLQKFLKPEHIIVSDFGDCLFGSADLILDQDCYISNAYFATLGFGVPGAIGAQIAAPNNRVVGVVGDGAFQMTCMELSTAVRYHVDPIIILVNNHGFATERPLLEGDFNELVDWNYSEIPKVLKSGVGIHVTSEEGLEKALEKAFSTRGEYYLIEVVLEKTDFSPALKRFCELFSVKQKG